MARSTTITGEGIRDESVESVDIASGSIKAGELNPQAISGQSTITSTDTSNDRLLIWDATDSALKQVAPGNLGLGGGGSVAGSDTQVQYNNGGSFGGAAQLLYDDSNHRLGIGSTDAPDYTLDVAGDIGVDRYIYHNGDADTLVDFTDDKIVLKAGNLALVTAEKKGSAPHEVTINDGANNVDFVVKGNNSNQGNPGMKFDGSTNRLGINGVGSPSWELDVAGDIGLGEYIYHRTDTDTYIQFEDDIITFAAGGRSFIKIEEASTDKVVINNGLLDIDLKVGGENLANLIRTDAANDRVGIGLSTPQSLLHVHSDSTSGGVITVSQCADDGDASQLDLSKGRGTASSPSAVQGDDFLGHIRFLGYDGDSYDSFADIYVQASGSVSTTSHPGKIVMRTVREGATSPTEAVTIDNQQNMRVNGNVYGRMMHMTHHRYNDGSGTGLEYIPWAGTSEQPSPSWITQGVAPYEGRLAKVLVRSSKSGGMGSTTVGVHKNTDGNTVLDPTPEETSVINMTQQNTSYIFNFTGTTHFGPGDVIGVSIDPTNAHGNVNVTCVWEYDITDSI